MDVSFETAGVDVSFETENAENAGVDLQENTGVDDPNDMENEFEENANEFENANEMRTPKTKTLKIMG